MQRTKSQLNAIYYAHRDRLERRRTAAKALYSWVDGLRDIQESTRIWLKKAIDEGLAGEFVETSGGFREARRSINWRAVGYPIVLPWTVVYTEFETYRAAVRAQKSHYYRRRLAKLGIDWRHVQKPYGTEAIEID